MSSAELRRVEVFGQVASGSLGLVDAAEIFQLSYRLGQKTPAQEHQHLRPALCASPGAPGRLPPAKTECRGVGRHLPPGDGAFGEQRLGGALPTDVLCNCCRPAAVTAREAKRWSTSPPTELWKCGIAESAWPGKKFPLRKVLAALRRSKRSTCRTRAHARSPTRSTPTSVGRRKPSDARGGRCSSARSPPEARWALPLRLPAPPKTRCQAPLQHPPRQALPSPPRGHFNRGKKGDIFKEL